MTRTSFQPSAVAGEETARRELVSEVCRWPDGDEEPQEMFVRLSALVRQAAPIDGFVLVASDARGAPELLAQVGEQAATDAALEAISAAGEGGDAPAPITVLPLARGSETIGWLALTTNGVVPLSNADRAFFGFFSTVLAQARPV